MNCRQVEQLLSHHFEGSLREREARALQSHLDRCRACRRVQEELHAVRSDLRDLAHQLSLPESGSDHRAIDRWLAEQQRVPHRRGGWLRTAAARARSARLHVLSPWRALSPAAFGGVAAALLLAALGLLLARSMPQRRPAPTYPMVHRPDPAGKSAPSRQMAKVSTPEGPGMLHEPRPRESTPATALQHPRLPGPWPVDLTGGRSPRPPRPRGLRRPVPVAGDLTTLNGNPEQQLHKWVSLPNDQWEQIEARVLPLIHVREEFITIPFPQIAGRSERAITEALESYKREAAIVDARLSREVTCAFKGMALSDVCDRLRSDTGIQLSAGPSVADEKVTVFCENLALRDVMRQLSRPFGYTWLRTKQASGVRREASGGTAANTGDWRLASDASYRYELVQDLKSQLVEEELRNQDSNAALLDVDRQMGQYRDYLGLSPDQALARAASASPEAKQRLEYLAGKGWGPAQLYFQLSPAELAALRAGQTLTFSATPGPGELPLPPEMARNVLASLRDYRIARHGDDFQGAPARYLPDGLPPTAVREAQPIAALHLDRSELGQLTLQGLSGFYIGGRERPGDLKLQLMGDDDRSLALGLSPATRSPENAAANAVLAHDPALQGRVTAAPGARRQTPDASPADASRQAPGASPENTEQVSGVTPTGTGVRRLASGVSKVTSADVLEALHRATGLPIVSDYYTRLFPAASVSVSKQTLFEALNWLADAMRMRWRKEGSPSGPGRAHAWLEFRSANFYNDRWKEVPNRLLFRWAASRREHGALTLDDLIEISQLPDAQLDSSDMAEGARVLFGLDGWDLTRRSEMRANWRFLASLTPEQLQLAQNASGLPFTRMALAQQQQFLALLPSQIDPFRSLVDLGGGSVQVAYTAPGEFQWTPLEPDASPTRRLQESPRVVAPTRQAALLAAQRIDPQVTEGQIAPTDYTVALTYRLGGPTARLTPLVIRADLHNVLARLPQPVAPDGRADGRTVVSGGQ